MSSCIIPAHHYAPAPRPPAPRSDTAHLIFRPLRSYLRPAHMLRSTYVTEVCEVTDLKSNYIKRC